MSLSFRHRNQIFLVLGTLQLVGIATFEQGFVDWALDPVAAAVAAVVAAAAGAGVLKMVCTD